LGGSDVVAVDGGTGASEVALEVPPVPVPLFPSCFILST